MGEVGNRVQLFAKAKELAGGRDCLVCALQLPADASISCEDFLERYVYTVARHPRCAPPAPRLRCQGPTGARRASACAVPPLLTPAPRWCAAGRAQVEPKLGVLRGSAFLAVNDEYVEPADILSLKVRPLSAAAGRVPMPDDADTTRQHVTWRVTCALPPTRMVCIHAPPACATALLPQALVTAVRRACLRTQSSDDVALIPPISGG